MTAIENDKDCNLPALLIIFISIFWRFWIKLYFCSFRNCCKFENTFVKHWLLFQRSFTRSVSAQGTDWLFSRVGGQRRNPWHLLVHECSLVRDHQRLQAIMWSQPVQERSKVQRVVEQVPVCLWESLGLHR